MKMFLKKQTKKTMIMFVVFATVIWAAGLATLLPAHAAVTVVTENRMMGNWNMGGGMMIDLAALKITASAGETLNSIKVRFSDIGSSGSTPATILAAFNAAGAGGANDSQGLCIYKDGNNNGWFDPGSGDTVLAWEVQPTWSDAGGGHYDATLDIVDDTLPTSYTGNWNYFVHMQMHATPPAGKSFQFTFQGGAGGTVVTSATSPTITAFSTDSITASGDDAGGFSESPHVVDVFYGDGASLIVDFDKDMDATSSECASAVACENKYILKTDATDITNDAQMVTAASRDGTDHSKIALTLAANARISPSGGDGLSVSADPLYAPRDEANNMPNDSSMFRQPILEFSLVKISEIQFASTANTTDEFIEIFSPAPVDITGYTLRFFDQSANTFSDLSVIGDTNADSVADITVNLAAGGHYLLANNANDFHLDVDGAGTDADALFTGVDFAEHDAIFLLTASDVAVDLVSTGSSAVIFEQNSATFPAVDGSIERKATYSSTAALMAGAHALAGNFYDSDNNSYDFVVRTTSDPQTSVASVELFADAGLDYSNSAPTIDHMGIYSAVANQSIDLHADVMDVEDTFSSFNTVELCYMTTGGTWATDETCVNGVKGYDVSFTIPASAVTSSGVDYYIHAQDSQSADVWNSATPTVASQALARTNAYQINVTTTSGSRKILGNVYQSDCATAINGATVRLEGMASSDVTDSNGLFTITGVPDGMYNLKATAGGYIESVIWGVSVSPNFPESGGWNFCLEAGSGGQGGDGDAPMVIQTMPNPGMMGAPIDIVEDRAPILMFFNKEMDSSTITCDPCDANTANIKLKKFDGGSMKKLGNAGDGLSAYAYKVGLDEGGGVGGQNFGGTPTNPVAVIYMVQMLEKNTNYTVEITPAVKDVAGNSVEGSRPGGGEEFSFTTSGTDNNFHGDTGGFGFIEDESFWMTGSFDNMINDTAYQSMMTESFNSDTGKFMGGAFNPPYIQSTVPSPGSWNVPMNTDKLLVTFNEAMDAVTANKGSFTLFSVANGTETDVTATYVDTVSLSSDKKTVSMDITSNGFAAGVYRLKVKGGVRASSGLTLGPPDDPGMIFYDSEFTVTSTTDATAPSIQSSYPDDVDTNVPLDFGFVSVGLSEAVDASNVNSMNVTLKTGNTTVPCNVEYMPMEKTIEIMPLSALSPGAKYTTTLTLGGTSGIKDLAGLPAVATTDTLSFTMTTTTDSTKPRVEFSDCDDYMCSITFSEPMNATKASASASNANQWAKSVLNPANYTLTFGADGTGSTETLTDSEVMFEYYAKHNTVDIKGLSFTGATTGTTKFIVTAAVTAADAYNNPVDSTANTAKGTLRSKVDTGGFMGPGMMMGMGDMSGDFVGGFGDFKPMEAMMMGAMVHPMNMMAGATTTYFVDFPIAPSGSSANVLDDGGYVKLTFPKGFDVSSVLPDPYNPAAGDLNWDGPSTVVLKTSAVTADGAAAATKGATADDGVTVSGQTVTVWLDTNSGNTGDPDMLHFEIKGIVNSTVVKDFESDGYSVDMKSYKADGTLVESKTSMPFYLNEAGTNSITVNITAASADGDMLLMMGSPMSGPMDATVTLSSGTGSNIWSNLSDGCYHIFTEPTINIGVDKYTGQMNPEPICVASTESATKNLTFTKLSASNAAQLTVKVSGTFAAGGEDIDIFAGGPNSFAVETTTLTGTVVNDETVLYLPSNGNYMVGMGPAMPKGPMMGPMPMPDWMPPMSVNIEVSGVGGTPVIKTTSNNTAVTELSFSINSASKQIIGRMISSETTLAANYTASATTLTLTSGTSFGADDYIVLYDGTNTESGQIESISGTTVTLKNGISQAFSSGATVYNALPNAEVWAHQPMGFGGMGSHDSTDTAGQFVLKVAVNGTYEIGAWKDGLGEAPFKTVTVKNDNVGTADLNATSDGLNNTADLKADGALITTSNPFLIKMVRPDYTISGKVSDASGNPLSYTHLMAEEATSRQMVHSNTDSDGDYILNVGVGTWTITGHMPQNADMCGSLTKDVTVSAETGSRDYQNIQPSTTTCYTISGTITIDDAAQANIPIMIEAWDTTNDWPSGGYSRHEMTNTVGEYTVKVGGGVTYRLSTWSPDYGEIGQNVTVAAANKVSNITYSTANLKTLTLAFTGGTSSMRGFVEAKSTSSPVRKGQPVPDLSQGTTMSLPADTYKVLVFVDGLGDFSPTSDTVLTSDATVTIDVSGQTSHTVSGTILDASDVAISGAAVVLVDETTGLTKQATTDTSGNYSLDILEGSYSVKATHKDYVAPVKATLSVTGDVNYDFDSDVINEDVAVNNNLTEKDGTISGTISKSDSSVVNTGGFVWAESADGETAKAAINEDGTYDLAVTDGVWTVKADAPLHAETTRSTTVTVSGSAVVSVNIGLTADATDIKKSDSRTIVPSGGVTIDDSDTTNGTGVEINAGPTVFGRTNSGTVIIEEVDMPDTEIAEVLGNAIDISAQEGTTTTTDVNQLNGDGAEIIIHYTDAELTAAGVTDESILSLSYYDETTDNYMPLNDAVCDASANVCSGYITHLTPVTITHPPIAVASTPASSPGGAVILPVEAEEEEEEEVVEEEVVVEEDVVAEEDAVEPEVEVVETVAEVVTSEAITVKKGVTVADAVPVLPAGSLRDLTAEGSAIGKFVSVEGALPSTSADWSTVNFVAYGSSSATKALAERKRVDLVKDYKSVYGKLPADANDWQNLALMAEGATPKRVLSKEAQALKEFVRVFKRLVDFKVSADESFIHMVAYRLRIANRDLAREQAGLGKFISAYGFLPKTSHAWSVLRALSYIDVK